MGCNLCGVPTDSTGTAYCNKCRHGLCENVYNGALTPRVYSWLRASGNLVNGLMFDPRKFFTELMKESVYHRVPKYVQSAMADLVVDSNGYFGELETFQSMDDFIPYVNYMVVKSGSDKLHFGAIIWTLDTSRKGLSCMQENANLVLRENKLIPSSLVCIKMTNDSHVLPDLSSFSDEEVESDVEGF